MTQADVRATAAAQSGAMRDANSIVVEAWNTILFEKFCRFRHLLTHGLSAHSDELLRRHPPRAGGDVLDVGCGFGDTTLQLAASVGPSGSATGVDCAANFIDSARCDAEGEALGNARYFVGDVQSTPLGGPYEYAFSRFGTMFFTSPGAALRNVRRALLPGGALHLIVWRRREDNPWLHEAERTVRQLVPVVSHEETDQVHCGPGPFSMAGPDLVSDLLQASGFTQVGFERFDTDICIGRDLDEAIDFAMALGPAGEIIRLAGEAARARQTDVALALRETLQRFARQDGIWAPSSTWFVRAINPG
jgi:ubiquinone/menaquinone biosynthesis C-methylase UbiE